MTPGERRGAGHREIRLMDKMMHHPNQPRRGRPGNICDKKGRTRPPVPPDLNVGEKKILVSGGATILSIRGNTPVPPTSRSGWCGGWWACSPGKNLSLPAPLLQVARHFVHTQYHYPSRTLRAYESGTRTKFWYAYQNDQSAYQNLVRVPNLVHVPNSVRA